MRCCGAGGPQPDKEEVRANKNISKQLKKDQEDFDNEMKLLLLGAGESGKSTIAKQMKIIHMNGFTDDERNSYKSLIYNNTFHGMKTMVTAARDLGIEMKEDKNKEIANNILNNAQYFTGEITPAIAADITSLWGDAGIKTAFSRSSEYQLGDSAEYYIENVKRLAESGYVPNDQDVLRSRVMTTGIIETAFEVNKTRFRLVDVGGQRSERKKWMHCFTDVAAVLFCVALSEYDLKLIEDNKTPRMNESLKLFGEICNSRWFVETSMILFLNKSDLFQEKIEKVPLNVAFADYTGKQTFEDTTEFIKKKFVEMNKDMKKIIYCHITCATDTNNVKVVFEAVKDTVLQKALKDSGLGL
eukprot:TRINITY_DN9698_c0_g1_i1.p1 TRINITY_DN9698_c0_g1~~TRINITY_DN9698_c0_g1_i1.p1  ORF type:complete len:357 (+),score=105.17 TRINITY_DN9698_c0_g1_i1:42-1112(+)